MALAIWGQGDSALEEGGSFETWGRIWGGGGWNSKLGRETSSLRLGWGIE